MIQVAVDALGTPELQFAGLVHDPPDGFVQLSQLPVSGRNAPTASARAEPAPASPAQTTTPSRPSAMRQLPTILALDAPLLI